MARFSSTTYALPGSLLQASVLVLGLSLSVAAGRLAAQSPTPNPPPVSRLNFTEQDIAQAIGENEALLRKYPDQDFTPLVMFQLCELYVRRSTVKYQKAMADYDAALKRLEDGGLLPATATNGHSGAGAETEPAAPRIDFTNAIAIADQIIIKYPTADFLDKVLYRVALCHSESGNAEQARAHLERLVQEYPRSSYLLESYFRLGESYFDKRQYDRAIEAYSKLFNKWDNAYFNMALYKLGWSYYNIDDYAKAISTFIYLIDDMNKVSTMKDATALGATKIDLRKEAIEYTAVCFAEFGGAHKAEKFLAEFLSSTAPIGAPRNSAPTEREYIVDIFLKLADTYHDRNAYDESSATLETLLRRWPLHVQAPQLQNGIVENHLLNENPGKAEAARLTLVKDYGPGSAWLLHYSQHQNLPGAIEARISALTLADEALYTLATEAQERAQKSGDEGDYKLAVSRYKEYLEKFPSSPAVANVQYFQAECFYEIKAFAEAADAYHKVVANYPASKFADEAAYNRVIAHLEEINQTTTVDSLAYQITDFLGTGINQILRLPNKAYARFLNACSDYSKVSSTNGSVPDSMNTSSPDSATVLHAGEFAKRREKLPEVMMKYGETLYKLGQFELSRQVYAKVATELPSNKFALHAMTMVAQSNFQVGNFQDSEKWYGRIIAGFPDSTRQVERAQKMIASTTFKIAEDLKTGGDSLAAAQAFASLADSTSDEEISKRSFLEAATLYENSGDKAKSMAVYQQLFEKFPDAEGADLTLLKAGQLAEELSDWPRAAQSYLTLANAFPVSEHAPRAVFQAGLCYENASDTVNAISTYRRFTQTYKDDPTQLLEVMVKLGELHFNRGQLVDAKSWLHETIAAYKKFAAEQQPADEYMPAQAQFLLAEMRFKDYRKIELTPPVDRNFQKKQKLFNEVLVAYRDAADYQVAEWTTAATFKIGATFEEFARAFADAPPPTGLSESDMDVYDESLEQKIRPFKEKALETYRSTLRLAEENNVQNSWVASSRERAEALASELGMPRVGEVTPAPADDVTFKQSTNRATQ